MREGGRKEGGIQIQIQIHLFGHIADPGDLC